MIDPQTVNLALMQQLENEFMGLPEDVVILLTKCSQIIDVKKSAVVNVVCCDPPVSQSEGLSLDEFMQRIKRAGFARNAVDSLDYALQKFGDLRRTGA